MAPDRHAQFRFEGFVGDRVSANIHNWLLTAPASNPGMIEMFRQRDRQPTPNLVPWAGEFVGKYLISAIQALRMSDEPALRTTVSNVVSQLIATQADDGYLGPFPKKDRLLGNWDLWGHYHCMLGLLMWHELTGDKATLEATRRVADLVCKIYLEGNRRPIDAKSDEMNLSIIHSLGWLYRITKEPRYLKMMQVIEKDWEQGGDYLRTGLSGVEFYKTPRPRWESLHNLQGLVELYRISGDKRYRQAFEHHWRSIAQWDIRNTGGFSSGEKATGNPYANTPIETCCTIAWMAISVDMLSLTAESRVADFLELAAFNAWAGAQHPTGRWCTYNTPMDGVREASAHTIVFQSRAGTPELNCCSVNGPRGWGMLSDWAVMKSSNGIAINWYGPAGIKTMLPDQTKVEIQIDGNYPVESSLNLTINPDAQREFPLLLRIPGWSTHTLISVNNEKLSEPPVGQYLALKRIWKKGDRVKLQLDLKLRTVAGQNEALGKVSLYRGPILLAFDQKYNVADDAPKLAQKDLTNTKMVFVNEARSAV